MNLDEIAANGRPCLLLMTDTALRADSLRVAAAADCVALERDLPVGNGPESIRLDWDDAGIVVLDVDAAATATALRLPRRSGVVVLARGDATVEHWRAATSIGADCVIELPGDEERLIRLMARSHEDVVDGGGVITVVGARGGAGASSLSAATALASGAVSRTLLIDGDEYGSGLDLLLGWEDDPGLRWPGLVVEAGRISADSLHSALPSRGSLAVLAAGRVTPGSRGGVGPVAATAVIDAGRRAGDLVVCDVPRQPSASTDAFHDAADLVVVVVPADLAGVAAAENVIGYLSSRNSNVGLVVRGPAPGGLTAGVIADALQRPLLASMRPVPGLPGRVERGGLTLTRRSPLAEAAQAVLRTFARKPQTTRGVA